MQPWPSKENVDHLRRNFFFKSQAWSPCNTDTGTENYAAFINTILNKITNNDSTIIIQIDISVTQTLLICILKYSDKVNATIEYILTFKRFNKSLNNQYFLKIKLFFVYQYRSLT